MKQILIALFILCSFVSEAQLDTYQPVNVSFNIDSILVNNTIIRRTATTKDMNYDFDNQQVIVYWVVKYYADSAGKYGQYLGLIIPDKHRTIKADNTVMVNDSTGAFIYPDSTGNYPQNVPYIGQYNFFNRMAQYNPVIVNQLIEMYGKNASWDENLLH